MRAVKPYLNNLSRGTDFEAAKEFGIKAVHALSLPGKVAPISSAKYIAEVADGIWKKSEGGLWI